MMTRLETLKNNLQTTLGADIALTEALGEITVVVAAADYSAACLILRDDPALRLRSVSTSVASIT